MSAAAVRTEAEIEQRRQAATHHGMRSTFAKTGDESALQPAQRSRLAELRADLATPEGVNAALVERAARLVLIAEWGEEWLRDKAEREGAIAAFSSPMLARFFSAAAEARRALVEVSKLNGGPVDGAPSAAKVLESIGGNHDERG